ncbi:MAG: hypothetical protein Q7T89_17900 [Anaerolineales bacterium]|nr:hypothetical protein [Anaerolineales bacterium]
MFRNRTFKVLSNLILLMVLCTGQVSAVPSNTENVQNTAIKIQA